MTCACEVDDSGKINTREVCIVHAIWAETMMVQSRRECLGVLDTIHAAIEEHSFGLRLSAFKDQQSEAPIWKREPAP